MRLGAQHQADLIELIPRLESDEWSERIGKSLARVDAELRWELVGSYRRGEPFSHAIDVVLWHPDVRSLDTQRKRTAELVDALVGNLENGECSRTVNSMLWLELHRYDAERLLVAKLWGGPRQRIELVRLPCDNEGSPRLARRLSECCKSSPSVSSLIKPPILPDILFTVSPGSALLVKSEYAMLLGAHHRLFAACHAHKPSVSLQLAPQVSIRFCVGRLMSLE